MWVSPTHNNFEANGLIFIKFGINIITDENKQYKGREAFNGMV
jgi:hypothetical protein